MVHPALRQLSETRERFLRVKAHLASIFASPDERGPSIAFVIEATPETQSAIASLKGVAARMARAAGRPLFLRLSWFDAVIFQTSMASIDPAQIEYTLSRVKPGGLPTLPALVGFTEGLASAVTDMPSMRPDAVILIGSTFQQDPSGAQILAARLKAQGTKIHCFQTGSKVMTEDVFRHLCAMTGGRFARIDEPHSLEELCEQAVLETQNAPAP